VIVVGACFIGAQVRAQTNDPNGGQPQRPTPVGAATPQGQLKVTTNQIPTDPNDITHLTAGRAAFEARQYDRALAEFYLFCQQRPTNLSVHFWLASTLAAMGRDQEAVVEYVKCLGFSKSIDLDSAEMRNNLANDIIARGHFGEALFDYKRATIIDPRCTAPYLGLAKCLIEAGNFDEALMALTNYQKAGGKDVNAILLHGLALAGKDQFEPAKQDLTSFINAAQNGANNGPLDQDLGVSRERYVTTGGVSPAALDLARRILNEIQHRQ
jgi:Flp pilus assembly protein TadD